MDTKKILQTVLIIIFVGLITVSGFYFFKSFFGKKEAGNIISASGRIEGDEYNTASKVAGKVEKVLVDEGQDVKKGELVAFLYSQQIKSQLEYAQKEVDIWRNKLNQAELALAQSRSNTDATIKQAQANLAANDSRLKKAYESHRQSQLSYQQAQANIRKAKANLAYCEKEYVRYKNLVKEDAVPRTKFDAVETQYLTAKEEYNLAGKEAEKAQAGISSEAASVTEGEANLEAGRANLNLAMTGTYDVKLREEDIKNAKDMLEKAEAMLVSARADYEDTKIYSPITGRVIGKIIEPGEVIASGTPVLTIVDMDKLYLKVYLPTDKCGKLKIGNPVKIVPDALGNETFDGVVYKISSKAEFTPKNVETKEQRAKLVFEVKIRILNNKERKLKPGMPAEAKIDISKTIPTDNLKTE